MESALRIAGPDGRMAAGLRLGAGKGLEFNVAAEAAARAPDPRESWLSRRCAACPGPVIYCPGAKGAPTRADRARGGLYTVCFKLRVWSSPPARAATPWAVTFFFFSLPFLWQPETRHRRPAWPRLGPACRSPYHQLISESLGPRMRGGGSWERDTGRRPSSGSDLLRPDLEAGREDPEPGKRGLCGPTRPSHPARYRTRRSGERSAQPRSG